MTNDSARPIRTAVAGFGLSGSVFHAPLHRRRPRVLARRDLHLRRRPAGGRVRPVSRRPHGRYPGGHPCARRRPGPGGPGNPAGHPLPAGEGRAGSRTRRRRRQAVRRAQRRGPGAHRARRAAGTGAHGVPEPALGRRLPDCQGLLEGGLLGTVTRFESRFERWSPGGSQGLEGGGDGGRRRRGAVRPRHPPAGPGRAALRPGHGHARGTRRPGGPARRPTTTCSWPCGTNPASRAICG